MSRALLRLACLVALFCVVGCGSSSVATRVTGGAEQGYRDAAGWAIEVPSGWHVIRFSESKGGVAAAGVEVSNVRLATPTVLSGYPIQVNSLALPADGVGLVISTDADPRPTPGTVAVPPLPVPNGPGWSVGSALAGQPYLETLWFRAKGATFIASAKVGSKSDSADLKALAGIVRSLRS